MGRVIAALACWCWVATAADAAAQELAGQVLADVKITEGSGGFGGELHDGDGIRKGDGFGTAIVSLGDLDGDGVPDLAVGAPGTDSGGGVDRGAVWILFMAEDGSVKSESLIAPFSGGFVVPLADGDQFGAALAAVGDLDRDGVPDLLVGAPGTDGTLDAEGLFEAEGAAYVLLLTAEGTVKSSTSIGSISTPLATSLSPGDRFGSAAAALDDLDGDGRVEVAVSAPGHLGSQGAVYVLTLDGNGAAVVAVRIAEGEGGFRGTGGKGFAESVAGIGDLDGDGVADLAVGAPHDDDGAFIDEDFVVHWNFGAVWILFLAADGTVAGASKISNTEGGLPEGLPSCGFAGRALAGLGDLDGDGVADLALGAPGHFDFDECEDVGDKLGRVHVLFLQPDGSVRGERRFGLGEGGFGGSYDAIDSFGGALAAAGDLNGDGTADLAVGAPVLLGSFGFTGYPGALWTILLSDGHWVDLGGGLSGAHGTPQLAGAGSLSPGAPVVVLLEQAPPERLALLVVGGSKLAAPLLGGQLVPAPDHIQPGVVAGRGDLAWEGRWPALPPGTTLWFQAWVVDGSAPQGFAASNGVASTQP